MVSAPAASRTRLFGRDPEVAALVARLAAPTPPRLVTLVGPAGVGTTRLAREVVVRLRATAGADAGAYAWLELGPERDPARAVALVSEVVRARSGRLVLVLDAVDRHARALAEALPELLAAAPESVLVATGHGALGCAGEVVHALAPLTLAGGLASPAAALFRDRAERAGARPATLDHDTAGLERLVRRLDGLPLALELAAARADVLTPSQILALVEARFEALQAPSRGRAERAPSMHAALAAAWELTPDDARRALVALSVLAAPFEAATAAAVMDLPGEAAGALLTRLAAASWLLADDARHHRLLWTTRAFLRGVDPDSGLEQAARARRDRFVVSRGAELLALSNRRGGREARAALADLREDLAALAAADRDAPAGREARRLGAELDRSTLAPPHAAWAGTPPGPGIDTEPWILPAVAARAAGDRATARAHLAAGEAHAADLGDRHLAARLALAHGAMDLVDGALAAAETRLGAVYDAAREAAPDLAAAAAADLAWLMLERGEPARADRWLDAARDTPWHAELVATRQALGGDTAGTPRELAARCASAFAARAAAAVRGDGEVLCVAPDRSALRRVGEWQSLVQKPTLRRVFAALVAARLDAPGQPLTAATLGAHGWPGEKMLDDARDNRLYVTLTKLRQLGLGPALAHDARGWWLAAELPLLFVEPAAWPAP